jgi:hypothetical protein
MYGFKLSERHRQGVYKSDIPDVMMTSRYNVCHSTALQVLNRSLDPRAAAIGSDGTGSVDQSQQQQQQQLIAVPPIPGQLVAAPMPATTVLQSNAFGQLATVQLTPAGGASGSGILPHGAAVLFPQQMITCGTKRDCLRIRGLPYEATVSDILSILGECSKSITFQGVHLIYNSMVSNRTQD